MISSDAADLRLALGLAEVADAITLRGWRGPLARRNKPDGSVVTDIDIAVEDAIVTMLARERPDDFVLAEESGVSGNHRAERRWYLDPLDQTVNYSQGLPEFATLIALYAGEHPVCAVVSAPAMKERWWAAKGYGARNSSGRISVSNTTALEDAVVSIAAPHRFVDLDFLHGGALAPGESVLAFSRRCRATTGNGGFLGQMRVAEGRADISLDPWGEAWDLAASALIVREAGGLFTSLSGEPSIHQHSAIASNGHIHWQTLRALTEEGQREPSPV